MKTLSLFASRQRNTYVPNKNVWLNKLYFETSNSKEKKCLTIDIRVVNNFGPGKFRTSADNGEEQTCYFNRNKSDTHFTSFFAQRTQAEPIRFSIVKPNSEFDFVNKSLNIDVKVQCRIESLRGNYNKLVQKTLAMEDLRIKNEEPTVTDYMTTLQSRPMYGSHNAVN